MKKVLIVGGAGYVGSVLTRELLERGYAVRVLDRLYFGDDGLKGVRDRVELVQGDMRRLPAGLFDDVSAVINLGGLSNDPTAEYNPRANYQMNTEATIALAEQCITHGIRRFVFASSCSIYDRGVGDEERDVLLDEDSEVDPRAAYSGAKRAAEIKLLEMKSEAFCPVILRKGTIYGFSPRMRYDLVVNTFVKDALSKGYLNLHYGGEMWRPLVDVHDVARAYILALQADSGNVSGQIFNVVRRNFRISELALRVRDALESIGVRCDVRVDYGYKGVRSYRVSGRKIDHMLGFRSKIDVHEAVEHMVEQVRAYNYLDFENPKYYNIRWMQLLEQAKQVIDVTGSVFGAESD
jgi:nucleoside-diphosphate-sugar epimerase